MKTAISLPDVVFERADQLASKMRVSRSQLYVMALEKFISEQERDNVTTKINDFIDRHGQPTDPVFLDAAVSDMKKVEW